MREISSGMTASDKTCQPYFSAASFSAGPPRSLYSPAVARSEMVMMPTVICIVALPSHRAFRFFQQTNIRDAHLFIHGFAHVVNGEQRHRDAGQRFHFHAGLRDGARGA